MPETNIIEREKKKYKLTDEEFNALPSYIRVYVERGRSLPATWMADYRKKTPAQPTRADSTFRPITDKYGRPTGETVGFNIAKPVDIRALRTFDIAEAKKEVPEKLRPPKTEEEAYQRKISGFTGKIEDLSKTAKRLEELDIEAKPITQQIEALSDSIRIASKAFDITKKAKSRKELISGKRKLTAKQKNHAETTRASINMSLRAGVPIERIRELIKDNWGITLAEFNQIYKNNQ